MTIADLPGGGTTARDDKPPRERLRARLTRWAFNLIPAYRGTGARLTYLAPDWSEVHVRLPLNWRTRNYVGTIFGGSLYGAVDPVYMMMLIKLLGPGYVVWDKAASIRFRKPGRSTLYARFRITPDEIAAIEAGAAAHPPIDRVYHVDLVDAAGVVHASVEKTIYIRRAGQNHPARRYRATHHVELGLRRRTEVADHEAGANTSSAPGRTRMVAGVSVTISPSALMGRGNVVVISNDWARAVTTRRRRP